MLAGVEAPTRQPGFRVSNAQDFFDFLRRHEPEAADRVLAAIPDAMREFLEHGARTGWIPLELDGAFVDQVVAELGEERAREQWRAFTASQLTKLPMMRALVDGLIRVFGLSVGTFIRLMPHGWKQSYRDMCHLHIDRSSGEARVTLGDFAPGVLDHRYDVLFHGVFLGLFDLANAEPRLDYSVGSEEIRAVFSWG